MYNLYLGDFSQPNVASLKNNISEYNLKFWKTDNLRYDIILELGEMIDAD